MLVVGGGGGAAAAATTENEELELEQQREICIVFRFKKMEKEMMIFQIGR